jgi:hypothetical protein
MVKALARSPREGVPPSQRRAGYVEWDNKKKSNTIVTNLGVPQGGIISPLLSNLVLNELDKHMEKLIKEREERNLNEKPHTPNKTYSRLSSNIARLAKQKTGNHHEDRQNRKMIRKLVRERRQHKTNKPNPRYIRFEYVRYADDWLVGIWGPKSEVKWLKGNIKSFLDGLKLELSTEKTLITNAREKKAKFLGTYIKRLSQNSGAARLTRNEKGAIRRAPTGGLWMTMPTEDIVERLKNKGFLKWRHRNLIPQAISRFCLLPIKDIILRFRVILYGYLNYFSFVDNPSGLLKIFWIRARVAGTHFFPPGRNTKEMSTENDM